ncbi:periplasmic heavy metal sensor [Asticcacaulis sp. BYS171W]|uniref:Periplasmic heavy metal sensor n=1 Tax=Asticcacaulis aquaticus TaxID=2984212 RepID=A0ABT5HS21_9CAUL|nr:periplasmic heavy metal sensor [Asticcacaulis aquaticus]
MSKKPTVKTWLVLSVVLNVFLAGSLIGAGVIAQKHFKPRPDKNLPALTRMVEGLSPANQEKARALLTEAALAGETDMNESRTHREAATRLVLEANPDPVAIQAEIMKARRVESSAKDKIETAILTLLLQLPIEERTKVADRLIKGPQRARAKAMYDVKKAQEKAEKEKADKEKAGKASASASAS